jgi:hypothetical protein
VEALLKAKLAESAYYKDVSSSQRSGPNPEHWLDAPLLLGKVFTEITGARVTFDKTDHSVRLTEWLLEHGPNHLAEIADLLVEALDGKATTPP